MPRNIPGVSIFFGLLLAGTTAYFMSWGLQGNAGNAPVLFVVATLFGLFMAFNIGGNDVANSFGTSVGAGTLTIKQALLVAAVFEVSGAMIAGGEVTNTIRAGIVDLSSMDVEPRKFIYIMMAALLAAAVWLLFASRRGLPVSTTHSIIGGIVGSSIALGVLTTGTDGALDVVHWDKIGTIALSWVLSPVLGGLFSYLLYFYIKKHILVFNEEIESQLKEIKAKKKALKKRHKRKFETLSDAEKLNYNAAMARDAQTTADDDFNVEDLESDYYRELYHLQRRKSNINARKALENYVPPIAALGAMVITSMIIFKGLKHMDIALSSMQNYLIVLMAGASVWMGTFILSRTIKGRSITRSTFLLFSWMQVFTASGFAFSHGANDIANAIGPFAAIFDVLQNGTIHSKAPVPPIAMLAFAVALISGLWFVGREVIKTVGTRLAEMHPASGFTAELAAAVVVMMATTFGIPVSSTHILIGAVLGIGIVNHDANWGLMKPIALAWIVTLPAAASLSAAVFYVLNIIF
jgi:PiT family inorganic phosphate transporter